MFQNCNVLAGKIREAINIKRMLLGKRAVFQLFQKPSHFVSWIKLSLRTKSIVALHQQREFFQLLSQTAVRLSGSFLQIHRRNTASFEFIDCINQLCQEIRFRLNRCICLQLAA